jgi:hypothetical protein
MPSLVGSLADNNDTNNPDPIGKEGSDLVSWVMTRVNRWRDDRDGTYEKVWGEYYRLWRGRHIDADKTRSTERSKLVSPALSQALEMTVAELEEATFGRDAWIDIVDDAGDPDHQDIDGVRRQFIDDMAKDKVPDSVGSAFTHGGLWGTLAAKVVVEMEGNAQIVTDDEGKQIVDTEPRIAVKVVAIPPMELIPDPDAEYVDDMLGIVHEVTKPRAWLLSQPFGKDYANDRGVVPNHDEDKIDMGDPEALTSSEPNQVLVTEYHGLVPKSLLKPQKPDSDPDDPLAAAVIQDDKGEGELDGDGEMVEAIVTIFDKKTLGRAIENPFMFKDRSIVAAPFERVPGRFWGRGVMEKGYNPQKALDAEIRTRMDVMALIANPMLGADQTALPRGFDLRVRPGKVWLTNSNPKEALYPVQFPNLDPASFSQTSEMERMVQMGTGAMDTATPLAENRRNETATGTSLIAGTFVKRSKRSLRTITNNFLNPLIRKILLRRMDFDEIRYPKDVNFRISSTLGIVAREIEQNQLTSMLSLVQDKPKTTGVLINALFDNSSSPYKAELTKALQEDAKPDPQAQQMQQMQQKASEAELQKLQAEAQLAAVDIPKRMMETRKLESDIMVNIAKIQEMAQKGVMDEKKSELEVARLMKELEEVRQFSRQVDVSAMKVIQDNNRGNSNDGTNKGGSEQT